MRKKYVVPGRAGSWALACLFLWLGCAGRQSGTPPRAHFDEETPLLSEHDGTPDAPPPEPSAPPPSRSQAPPEQPAEPAVAAASPAEDHGPVPYAGPKGRILRKDLIEFLDKPPGSFLRHVEQEPRFEGGRFRGWRILSFYPGDPRFVGIDLRTGDVVTKINGRPVEQPDQFFQVWQDLRAARELRVELLRSGRPHISRWDIVN